MITRWKYCCVLIAAFLLIGLFANRAQAQWWVGGRSYALRVDKYDSFYGEARPIWWSCQLPSRAPHFKPPVPYGYQHHGRCEQAVGEHHFRNHCRECCPEKCPPQHHFEADSTQPHQEAIDVKSSKMKQSQKSLIKPTCYHSKLSSGTTLNEAKLLDRLIRYESKR